MTVSRRTVLKTLAVAGAAGATAAVSGPAEASSGEPLKPAPDALGLLYDSTLCVGCQTCTVACQRANGLGESRVEINGAPFDFPTDLNATNKTVIKLYRGDGDRYAFMKMQCMQCLDPACTKACMLGSLQKRENGIVTWDAIRCTGCRYCQISCAFNVPKFQWLSATPKIVKCELCRQRVDGKQGSACAEVCPRGAVVYGKTLELLAAAKARIAKDPKRYEPKVYGETDGGGTQTLYLSAAGVPFEKLGLPRLTDVPPEHLAMSVQHTIYKGFIAPAVLYVAAAYTILKNLRKEAHGSAAEGEKKEGNP
jgi:Fe-S-cluster-containing dehydrogenase component